MSSNDSPSIFITPQTPPRRKSTTNDLLTPATSTKKSIKSPVTYKKKQQTTKFPFTPATPQKSPCKSRKNLDLFTSNEKFGILLPSPSTIGSGRSHSLFTQAPPPPPIFDMKKINEFKVPTTPRKQIVYEPKLDVEDEDDWEIMDLDDVEKIPRTEMVNPFIDNGESKTTIHQNVSNEVNYDTHMELINNKTGKKRLVKLTKNQMKIKPKRLSFDNI
ncbi:hypothetical protein SBY92_001012 [Candida maltosa Xu316]|uniref:Uncharacterized protein n=1 Tax=Candida maltosa (strain Xu316) TaxID=1245528 RepID=M3HDP5_CANMX|nr:hypothetical protein G210_4460 [Candida maltosa Xu316]